MMMMHMAPQGASSAASHHASYPQASVAYSQRGGAYPQVSSAYPQGSVAYSQGAGVYVQGGGVYPQGVAYPQGVTYGMHGLPPGTVLYTQPQASPVYADPAAFHIDRERARYVMASQQANATTSLIRDRMEGGDIKKMRAFSRLKGAYASTTLLASVPSLPSLCYTILHRSLCREFASTPFDRVLS
jgi:hypothetical protein